MTAARKKLQASSVYVRIRPKAEAGGHADSDLDAKEAKKKLKRWTNSSVTMEDKHGCEEYDFPTTVIGPEATQEEAYQEMVYEFVDHFTRMRGNNILFFAYGQTGTGKTHTIFGPNSALEHGTRHPQWGIFPRVVDEVFTTMRKRTGTKFALCASAIEFYLGGCYDLLADHNPIYIASDFAPRGHEMQRLQSTEDLLPLLDQVRKNRSTRATRMNEKTDDCEGSSRSHCALLLTLIQVNASGECCKTTFTLVDLAGAERPDKVSDVRFSAFEAFMAIQKGGEIPIGAQGVIINYELFEIGFAAIKAAEVHRRGNQYNPPKQLASQVLKLVGSCLDGTSMLGMVVTISQAARNGWETWFTMKYGTDLAKLKVPIVSQPSKHIAKAIDTARKQEEEALRLLEKTPREGTPASKYYFERQINVRDRQRFVQVLEELDKVRVADGPHGVGGG